MPTRLFIAGLPAVLTCVETPDVVEERINDARIDPEHESEYIDLHHIAGVQDVQHIPTEDGPPVVMVGDPHDSYAAMKVKYEYILGMRDLHEKEAI